MNDMEAADGGYVKYLPTAKVIELLSTLPANSHIAPNYVRNLTILDEDMNMIGWIDFLEEGEVVLQEATS